MKHESRNKNDKILEFIREESSKMNNIPSFEEGYIVLAQDNSVLNNRIFNTPTEAYDFKNRYDEHCPSLIDNSLQVLHITPENLRYGEFPYNKKLYLKLS